MERRSSPGHAFGHGAGAAGRSDHSAGPVRARTRVAQQRLDTEMMVVEKTSMRGSASWCGGNANVCIKYSSLPAFSDFIRKHKLPTGDENKVEVSPGNAPAVQVPDSNPGETRTSVPNTSNTYGDTFSMYEGASYPMSASSKLRRQISLC